MIHRTIVSLCAANFWFAIGLAAFAQVAVAPSSPLSEREKAVAVTLQDELYCGTLQSFLEDNIFNDGFELGAFMAMPREVADQLEACHEAEHAYSSYVLGMSRMFGFPQGYQSLPEALLYFTHAAHEGHELAGLLGVALILEEKTQDAVDRKYLRDNIGMVYTLIETVGLTAAEENELKETLSTLFSIETELEEIRAQRAEILAEIQRLENRIARSGGSSGSSPASTSSTNSTGLTPLRTGRIGSIQNVYLFESDEETSNMTGRFGGTELNGRQMAETVHRIANSSQMRRGYYTLFSDDAGNSYGFSLLGFDATIYRYTPADLDRMESELITLTVEQHRLGGGMTWDEYERTLYQEYKRKYYRVIPFAERVFERHLSALDVNNALLARLEHAINLADFDDAQSITGAIPKVPQSTWDRFNERFEAAMTEAGLR